MILLLAALAPALPARAGETGFGETASGDDVISGVDGMIGKLNDRLDSDKPLTSGDLDTVFDEAFFSSSDDPVRDMDTVSRKVSAKLADKERFDKPYARWADAKLYPAEFSPEMSSDTAHITVTLTEPENAVGQAQVNVARGRIKIYYESQEVSAASSADGGESYASSVKGRHRAMPVPKGADPARYEMKREDNAVTIVFARLKKAGRTEASK